MDQNNTFETEGNIYINPLTDFGFKRIFGDEEIMMDFLNDLIEPVSPITSIVFIDKDEVATNKYERGVIYDLRCKTADGNEIIVEMQKGEQQYFADRILYYLSRSIAPQGYKGKKMFCDKVRAYTIELPDYRDYKESDCKNHLDYWNYIMTHMETMKTQLPFLNEKPIFKKVASIASMAAMHSDELQSYMDSVDAYRTTMAAFAFSEMKGEERGRAEGRDERSVEIAKTMKAKGYAVDEISLLTGLSVDIVVTL